MVNRGNISYPRWERMDNLKLSEQYNALRDKLEAMRMQAFKLAADNRRLAIENVRLKYRARIATIFGVFCLLSSIVGLAIDALTHAPTH